MATITTAYTEYSDNGDTRIYTLPGHTANKPKIVVQKRKVPTGSQVMAEFSAQFVHWDGDAASAVLPERINFSAVVRYPITAAGSTQRTANLALFREFVASDEFAASIESLGWAE